MSEPEAKQRLKILQFQDQPAPPKPATRIKRADSLTGLSSLHKGVSELETVVTNQEKMLETQSVALTEAISHLKSQEAQIQKQELIIAGYQDKLSELDYLIDKIIG